MSKRRKKYTDEFKKEAVKLVVEMVIRFQRQPETREFMKAPLGDGKICMIVRF